jgi:dynactin complex subunit
MTLRKAKQSSVLLQKAQIDFLRNLARRIEKEGRKKMSRSEIMKVLMKTVTCIKPDIGECRTEEEVERELLKCLKKAVRELKR